MFGVDLATRPAPVFDEDALLKLAEIRVAQRQLGAQAAPVALPALPGDYSSMSPEQQAEADMARRRAQVAAQRVAITASAENRREPRFRSAIATELHAKGATVIGVARHVEPLDELRNNSEAGSSPWLVTSPTPNSPERSSKLTAHGSSSSTPEPCPWSAPTRAHLAVLQPELGSRHPARVSLDP